MHRASLCVTMGYTRRGKAGLIKGDERIGQDDSEMMCNVLCMGCSAVYRVGGNKRESAVGTDRARTAKRSNSKITRRQRLAGQRYQTKNWVLQDNENISRLRLRLGKRTYWIRLEACTSISSILNEFSSSLIL